MSARRRWFRREWDDFDVDWKVEGSHQSPDLWGFPEPWRDHPRAVGALRLRKELVRQFASEKMLAPVIRSEQGYLAEIRESVLANGIEQPLEVVIDNRGNIRLRDGHHRIIVAEHIEWLTHLPVLLVGSESINQYGQSLSALMPEILRSVR